MCLKRYSLGIFAGILLATSIVQAHHSTAPSTFETDLVEVDATVVKFRFANPHARFEYDIVGNDGNLERWVTVTHSINTLRRRGIKPDVMKPGDKVKIFGWRTRKGDHFMRVKEVQLSDKRLVRFWGRDIGIYAGDKAIVASKDVQRSATLKKEDNYSGNAPVNFAGLWKRAFFGGRVPPAPLNDKAKTIVENFNPITDDPVLNCSGGYPRSAGNPYPVEIIHHADAIYMLYEASNFVRRIYLDERQFPVGYPDTKGGYSIGKWEGSELVITTKNLQANLLNGFGSPISENAVVTERWAFVDPNDYGNVDSPTSRANNKQHLKVLKTDIFVDDPNYYKEPFLYKRAYYSYKPDLVLLEFLCDPLNSKAR